MDDVDRAQILMEADLERRIAAARSTPGMTLGVCVTCGAEISEARRNAVPGCCRCASCQCDHERQVRMCGHG